MAPNWGSVHNSMLYVVLSDTGRCFPRHYFPFSNCRILCEGCCSPIFHSFDQHITWLLSSSFAASSEVLDKFNLFF